MIYMCVMDYCDDHSHILAVRPHHRKYQFDLLDAGKVISGGSFLPDDDGGLFLYEAASLQEAERLVHDDPYVREGVVAAWKLREYEVHGVNRDLLRVTDPSKPVDPKDA